MYKKDFDTLSEAINELNQAGYKEDFKALDNKLVGCNTKKSYKPSELRIVGTYRFEGMTNPQDGSVVFAIEANDNTKGTIVMSYGAKHNQNVKLIKEIPEATD
ncbi:phosphoribosylpyrophosphate synthetase [Parvicella tangerina]|uniref:Phosphoribosylpyrophosphate synthetase n=1 Tax=Parvicella tangerina TaxID=2829795 RepID=A0A916NGN9_9FLAO|nr:phosphoribosylpyrophosphate synthetase [Parvicella tangerina]CAG5080156.1 hypothetical protein CRYO30217_01202 [Parvicella tangerina]